MTRTSVTPHTRRVRIVRRPTPRTHRALPLGARSVAHGLFPPGEFEDWRAQSYAKVMWCVSGVATVTFGGIDHSLSPHQVAVYLPDTIHRARAGDDPWDVWWWTMDGPLAAEMLAGFGLTSEGVYDASPPPTRELEDLTRAIADVTPSGEERASAIAYRLLAWASRRPRPRRSDALVDEALAVLEREWATPGLGVELLARRLRTHRSSLTRRFTSAVGISPIQYLTRLRMQRALSLLRQTDAPVGEIAHRCGYEDPSYFARLFHRTQGATPRQWRGG